MGIIASSAWKMTATGDRIDWNDIKGRIDLTRVVTALLGPAAKRQGRRLLWPCPFHDDGHPSFEVDPERKTWKCWPCNLGGDAPALVMKRIGVGFPEAVRIVAELSGIVTASGGSSSPAPRPATKAAAGKSEKTPDRTPERPSGLPLADALSLVTEAAHRLWTPEGTTALAYLHGRGLKDETIRAARLGWTPEVWIPTKEGDHCYRESGITIPWHDGDRLTKVNIRRPEGSVPKYRQAFGDRPGIFPRPAVFEPGRPLVITEGEFDALLLRQELRDLAAVVTLGSASSGQDRRGGIDPAILTRLLAAVPWYIATDADEAGDKAASGWPALARRLRPPEPFKDWTEAAQAGVNLRLWWAPRLGRETLWKELAAQRWGPAREEPAPEEGPDPYDVAEREAIQQEHAPPARR